MRIHAQGKSADESRHDNGDWFLVRHTNLPYSGPDVIERANLALATSGIDPSPKPRMLLTSLSDQSIGFITIIDSRAFLLGQRPIDVSQSAKVRPQNHPGNTVRGRPE